MKGAGRDREKDDGRWTGRQAVSGGRTEVATGSEADVLRVVAPWCEMQE